MTMHLRDAAVALPADRVPARRGRRCAARPDEDAVTLAAGAALSLLEDPPAPPQALIFATTTPPYEEGGSAQVLAELLGLPDDLFAVDLNASARDGIAALRLADGLLAAGCQGVLVCAAHVRRPSGDGDSGDGAVALLVGADEGVAALTPGPSHTEELRDRWRLTGEAAPQEADTSFTEEFGSARVAGLVAERAPIATGGAGGQVAVRIAGPSLRSATRVERRLGGPGDDVGSSTGVLGAAHALLRMLTALDEPGVVVAAAGGMADSVSISPGSDAAALAERTREAVAAGRPVDAPMPAANQAGFAPYASAPRAWRERGQDLRLEGIERDGRLHYPPPPATTGARRRLARTGTVVTWTRDHVYPGADDLEMAVVALDDGARFYGQAAAGEHVAIGDRVRLVPRRLHEGGGFVQYFWKVTPCR